MTFKVGDVVQLKSGGPVMTVEAADEEHNDVACVWFDKTKQDRGAFPKATLHPYTPPSSRVRTF